MNIKINNNGCLSFDLSRNNKKYRICIETKSYYINYKVFSKISYEEIVSIIESIESMLFRKSNFINLINLGKISLYFDEYKTCMKVFIKLDDIQEYSIILNRKNVLDIYNYLTKCVKTFNKINMIDFNKKYTYVEVRYIDTYCSNRYSYISEDKSIREGDIVYVDRAGTKCLAVVENKKDVYFEEAPYPVLETKRVIKIVTRAKEYKKVM